MSETSAARIGRKTIHSDGYVLVFVGKDHHLADVRGYAYEHRLNAEEKLGRRLRPGELVHHDNENKADNADDNLKPTTRADHIRHHRPRRGTGKSVCARGHARAGRKCRKCENDRARSRYIPRPRNTATLEANGRRVGALSGARQKAKTHCPSGHPYDAANTRVRGRRRICKMCHRIAEAQRRNLGK